MRHALALVLLAVAGACRAPQPAAPALLPGVETFELESRVLGETRRLCVYSPPAELAGTGPLPVLYLPDGGLQEDFVHVVEALHFGVAWGILAPVRVVGIENTERRRDLTGPTAVEGEHAIAPRVGGSAAFRTFLREELMPEVERRYGASSGRAIMGESLAGLFVVESFLLEPDLFDTWIAFSPSLWWNDHALVREAGERLAARPAGAARLYVTCANETDIVPWVAALARELAEHAPGDLEWTVLPRPDEFHDTIYRASAPRALRVLFAAPELEE